MLEGGIRMVGNLVAEILADHEKHGRPILDQAVFFAGHVGKHTMWICKRFEKLGRHKARKTRAQVHGHGLSCMA